jgi:hypothetical protein
MTRVQAAVINVPTDYATIQAAINAASSGDTIIVSSGSYAGAIINQSVSIQGGQGGESIITSGVPYKDGSGLTTAFRIEDTADQAEIRDFTIPCNATTSYYFAIFSRNADDIIVDSLLINDAVQGITNWGGSNWEITNNLLNNTEAAGGGGIAIWLGAYPPSYPVCSGNLIQNNTITATATAPDYTCPGIALGLDLRWGAYDSLTGSEDLSNNRILDNTISAPGSLNGVGIEMGILGLEGNTTRIQELLGVIHDNTIKGNAIDGADLGLYFYTVAGLEVQQNLIKNNNQGIYIADGTEDNHINYNNIFGNTIGLNNTAGVSVDARFNWWGDSTGPYHSTLNPTGLGDEVSDYVTFDHYLSGPFGAQLYTNPDPVQKVQADVCTYFNVSVTLENITDLFGFDLNITWDNTLITFNHCYYNDTLDVIWGSGHWEVVKNETGVNGGVGWYKLVAVSTASGFDTATSEILFDLEFHVERSCNFLLETPIYFEVVKLSNSHWTAIPAVVDHGLYQMSGTVPDLEFVVVGTPPFEYCDIFEVEIWVTHICANLKDYNFTILYDADLLEFVDVDYWGVLGDTTDQAGVMMVAPGQLQIWDTGGLTFNSGDGLLFGLTFHVAFDDSIDHIWRTCGNQNVTAQVSFGYAELSFEEGIKEMGDIAMPSPLDILIRLIRGDVDCDGDVDILDVRTVAAFYDQSVPVKYDLNCDNTIDIFDLVIVATNYGYGTP